MHIFCDFDGTITIEDTTDYVLTKLAHPDWLEVEAEWQRGLIGSGECMRRQIAMIRASLPELNDTLDTVDIDPGFFSFVESCRRSNTKITIVSDGVDYFIHRVLKNHDIRDYTILSNHLVIEPGGYRLESPNATKTCLSLAGTCKCAIVGQHAGTRVYIGDGRSDFCVSNKPEKVFAKGRLAEYCATNGIDFVHYETFHDITPLLQTMAGAGASMKTV